MRDFDIDIVIMWVDGSDPQWLKEKAKYRNDSFSVDDAINRYRDWDNLQYIFRGIEQFMPWVNRVHLITWGHLPNWLNHENDKLNIVRHEDFIPNECLPVFNANPIEINLHRINNLSDKFILFNDDMFVVRKVSRSIFFSKDGLPREQVAPVTLNSLSTADVMSHILLNNNAIMNQEYKPHRLSMQVWYKMFSPRNGLESLLRSLLLLPFSLRAVQSPDIPHMPSPFLKRTFVEVWSKYPESMMQTSRSKFRSITDVNQYLFKQWQIMSNSFKPLNIKKYSRYVSNFPQDLPRLASAFSNRRCKLLCINDNSVEGDFEVIKHEVNTYLNKRLPNKSSFEV